MRFARAMPRSSAMAGSSLTGGRVSSTRSRWTAAGPCACCSAALTPVRTAVGSAVHTASNRRRRSLDRLEWRWHLPLPTGDQRGEVRTVDQHSPLAEQRCVCGQRHLMGLARPVATALEVGEDDHVVGCSAQLAPPRRGPAKELDPLKGADHDTSTRHRHPLVFDRPADRQHRRPAQHVADEAWVTLPKGTEDRRRADFDRPVHRRDGGGQRQAP